MKTSALIRAVDVLEFLRITTQMSEQNHQSHGGYTSLFHFVHKNGRSMNNVLPPTHEMRDMSTPKECYRNAATIALRSRSRGKFIYCEGWAMGIVPVAHAWVIDQEGNTYDPTWGLNGQQYFGVAINAPFVRQVIRESTHYGVIEQPELGFPILTAHVREWRHPIMDRLERE